MLLLLGILFPLLGIGLTIGGVIVAVWQGRRFANMTAVEGVVIDLQREVYNPGSAGIYCPVVRFTTASGEQVEFQSEHGGRPALHKAGQTVTVLYDPGNPQDAEIRSPLTRWLVPGLMVAIGLLFLCGGCVLIAVYFLYLSAGSV